MLGGGFLKQGADSTKYNRSLLGKESRKPFERKDEQIRTNLSIIDDKTYSEEHRRQIQKQTWEFNRREIRRRLYAAAVTGVLIIAFLILAF